MFTGIAGFTEGIHQAYGKQKDGSPDRNGQGADASISSEDEQENSRHGPESPTCIGFSEIERDACSILRYRYPAITNFGDATELVPADIPDFELLCAGFPCQSFSIAGQRKGFDDTRGTMFFEIARILSHKRPAHFLLENVRNLASHDSGKTINRMLGILTDLDYFVEMPVLNSADYGVAQNRERCYFVGHLAERCPGEILSFTDSHRQVDEAESKRLVSGTITTKNQGPQCQFDASSTLIVGSDISFALDSNYYKGASPSDMESGMKRQMIIHDEQRGMRSVEDLRVGTLRTHNDGLGFREMKSGLCPTIPARAREDGSGQPVLSDDTGKIRRMTPIECARVQGFADDHADIGINDKGKKYRLSDTGLYRVYGNAVTTTVVEAVITKMRETGCLP